MKSQNSNDILSEAIFHDLPRSTFAYRSSAKRSPSMLHANASYVLLTPNHTDRPVRNPRRDLVRSVPRKIQLLLLPNLEGPLQSLSPLLPTDLGALTFLPDQTPDVALGNLIKPLTLDPPDHDCLTTTS